MPLAKIFFSGQLVDENQNLGYGPAHYLTRYQVKELNVEKLILFSNHQLERALKLYLQYGFRQIPVVNSPFHTADVMMELILKNDE